MQPALAAQYIWGAEIFFDALSWIKNWVVLYSATVLATNKHESAPAEHAVLVLVLAPHRPSTPASAAAVTITPPRRMTRSPNPTTKRGS